MKIHADRKMIIEPGTGEVTGEVAGFWTTRTVDEGKFVKVFVDGVAELCKLNTTAQRVFYILCEQLQKNWNADHIPMSYAMLDKKIYAMSRDTFQDGLRRLKSAGIIAEGQTQPFYWINPHYVFYGDRIQLVKEYRRAARNPPRTPEIETDYFVEDQPKDDALRAIFTDGTQHVEAEK